MRKIFYLGVEGGATKSEAILVDEFNHIVGQCIGGALNYRSVGEAGARKNLAHLINPLVKKTVKGKLYTVFGFAGLDTSGDELLYKKFVRSLLPHGSPFRVMNDADIGLEMRCPGEGNRVLVIAGTGSTVYGESESKQAKSIGWDFVLGDEGSGYYFGLNALRAAVSSWDGRSEKTVLKDLLLKRTHSKTMEDFIAKLYKRLSEKHDIKYYIASFAPLVDKAILKNDWAAIGIRDKGVQELVGGVFAVAERLNFKNKKFCIGLVGSQWKMPGLREIFEKKIKKQYPKAHFSDNKDSGAWGAILLAKKLK